MDHLIIRPERTGDYRAVEELHRRAFWNLYVPGCQEHYIAHVLRGRPDFVPVLADGPAGDPGGYPHLRPPGRGPWRQSIRYNNRRKSLWTSAISRAPLWPW